MERIKNIYFWNCLNDWVKALNMEMVHMIEAGAMGEGIFGWEQLIDMLYQNCFPQSLLCFRQADKNYLILTREQKKIFEFLKNEIVLQRKDGLQYLFSDFSTEFRNKVLNAQVDSVWIRLDNFCDLYNNSFINA